MAMKLRRGPSSDSPDFIWTLKKVRPARLPVKLVVADKGYDAERNHEYAWRSLRARAVMPLRWGGTPRIWFKGQYRRKQLKDRGAAIEDVSKALRHTSTVTTERFYARVRSETAFSRLRQAWEAPAAKFQDR